MTKDTGARLSIFIYPSTGTNMGTGAVLNSPPAKWPYQPKLLQVHTPLPYPLPSLCSWGAWQCFFIPSKLTGAPLLCLCSGLDKAGLALDHCICLAGICPSLPATLSLRVTPECLTRDTGTGGKHSSAPSQARRSDVQGTHGARSSSLLLCTASHPGPFPEHIPGSRGSSKSLPDEGAFLGFVKPRTVWEHR